MVSAQDAGIHNHSQNPIRASAGHYYGNDLWVTRSERDERERNPDKDIVWSHLLSFSSSVQIKEIKSDESVAIRVPPVNKLLGYTQENQIIVP